MSSATSLPYGINDTAVRTTLASSITSTDTSFDVGEVTNAPSTPFLIAVWVDQSPLREDDMEIMEVTAISGTTLTVNRGQKGTSAQSFSSGDKVFMGIVPSDVFDRDPAGIITSQSDIIAGDGTGSPSRITGSTTQDDVLKINSSGLPTFGPSPAGGAMEPLQELAPGSSTAQLVFDSLVTTNYRGYYVILETYTDGVKIFFEDDTGLNRKIYFNRGDVFKPNGSLASGDGGLFSKAKILDDDATATDKEFMMELTVFYPRQSNRRAIFSMQGLGKGRREYNGSFYSDPAVMTAVGSVQDKVSTNFGLESTGDFNGSSIVVYGIN
jgi:hypothetical protein